MGAVQPGTADREGAGPLGHIWLLPVFGGFVGGIVGAAFVYEKNPRQAAAVLAVGIATTVVLVLVLDWSRLASRLS